MDSNFCPSTVPREPTSGENYLPELSAPSQRVEEQSTLDSLHP